MQIIFPFVRFIFEDWTQNQDDWNRVFELVVKKIVTLKFFFFKSRIFMNYLEKTRSKFFLFIKVLCAVSPFRLSNQFYEFRYEPNGDLFRKDSAFRKCNEKNGSFHCLASLNCFILHSQSSYFIILLKKKKKK